MTKYAQLLGTEYRTFYDSEVDPSDPRRVFAFIIPQADTFETVIKKIRPDIVMTVCETEPVHENYRLILDRFPLVLVPSEFCKRVLSKQFPENAHKIHVFHHWPGQASIQTFPSRDKYTFYTIGNIIDPRKNIRTLIDAFQKCEFGDDVRLVLKATCRKKVVLEDSSPNVVIINGLLSDEQMESVHSSCDCYINCSYSEGVGMGAVEAAVRDKPVIITDFGGLQEYVKTPFVIKTTPKQIGFEDFLYEPHMEWGEPSVDDLMRHMKYCFENRIRTWNHEHTRQLTSPGVLRAKFAEFSLALTGGSV